MDLKSAIGKEHKNASSDTSTSAPSNTFSAFTRLIIFFSAGSQTGNYRDQGSNRVLLAERSGKRYNKFTTIGKGYEIELTRLITA